MPRRPRIHLDRVPLHIVQRGHNRQACFFADEDYAAYLHWLNEAMTKEGCRLHAYVLMTNHVHLLITPERATSIPRLIIALGRRYVQYINKSYRRTGTLWDSRYKSSLIDADNYLLQCQRYIEMNPVRAGMVSEPARYRWSSYRHHAFGEANRYLTNHELFRDLGGTEEQRRSAYQQLFRVELDDEPIDNLRLALNQNQPLGDARFLAQIEAMTGQRRKPMPRGRPRKSTEHTGQVGGQQELPL